MSYSSGLDGSQPRHKSLFLEKPMKHACSTIVAVLILILASHGSAAAQDMTAAEEALIKTQAQRHVEGYYNLYYERNPQALSTDVFSLPWITIGGNGISVHTTEEENLAYFEQAIAGLVARDWNRSTFTTKKVCALSAGSAIVSGTNTRTRTDGSVMSVGGVTYILGKNDDGWRIISYSGHAPNKVVRCVVE